MGATLDLIAIRKYKTFNAIEGFIESVHTANPLMPKLVSAVSDEISEIRDEISRDILTCTDITCDENYCESLKNILDKVNKENLVAQQFIYKCKKIRLILLLLMFLGAFFAVVSVLARNVIDMYIFCCLIWVLCCASLWITLNLIINDWTKNKYAQKK